MSESGVPPFESLPPSFKFVPRYQSRPFEISIPLQDTNSNIDTSLFSIYQLKKPFRLLTNWIASYLCSDYLNSISHVTKMARLQHTATRWSKSFPTLVSSQLLLYTCSYERGLKSCKKTFSRQCDLRSVSKSSNLGSN
jgi:hypothetical protein